MKRILVRGPNWIGDHVMALPFFRGLRKLYESDHITLLSKVRANDLCERHWDAFIQFQEVSKQPLKGNFDLGVTLPSSLSSAWLFFQLRIPIRVGFAEWASSLLLTDSLRWKGVTSGTHKSGNFNELLRWLGGEPKAIIVPERPAAQRKIVIAPGASIPLREWPYYPQLVLALNEAFPNHELVMVGLSEDAVMSGQCRRVGGRFLDLIGKTSLGELLEILKSAAAVIANDSGTAHLSGLVGCPCVVLFGPGSPRYAIPIGEKIVAVRDTNLPCSPCESAHCRAPYGYQTCLKNIGVGKVMTSVKQLLRSAHQTL